MRNAGNTSCNWKSNAGLNETSHILPLYGRLHVVASLTRLIVTIQSKTGKLPPPH